MLNKLTQNIVSKKFLITGGCGQIGLQLLPFMQARYGSNSISVSDIRKPDDFPDDTIPFYNLDVTVTLIQNKSEYLELVSEVKPTHILHLAAFLSAKAE